MIKNLELFLRGGILPWRGVRVINAAPAAKRWALAPFICNLIVYLAVFALMIALLKDWQVFDFRWEFWGGFGAWLAKIINAGGQIMRWLLALPVFLFVSYFTFALCGELLSSPFNDILSEKIETHLTRRLPPPGGWRQTLSCTWRSIGSTLRILMRQIFWMLVTLPLLFVPVAGQIAWFLVNSYFTGISYFDIAMARNGLNYREKITRIRQHRAEVIGLGSALTVLFMIPFLGIFMLPLGTAGGTILYCEDLARRAEISEFSRPAENS